MCVYIQYTSDKRQKALLFTGFFFLACLYASRMNEKKKKLREKKMYGKEELLRMMSHSGVLSKKWNWMLPIYEIPTYSTDV